MTTIPTVQRRVDGARDPRTYGLHPEADGATNYVALTKALTKAIYDASVSGRGCVSIPAGQYDMDVTTPETFRPTTNVTIKGVPRATILRPADPTLPLMQTSHLGTPPTGWLLEDLEIDMRFSEVTGGTYPTALIINEGCTDFAIRRVKIRNANTGMILRGPGIERFDVDVEVENSGTVPIDGGAHAMSVTGDSLDDAFDCRYGRIKLRGHNCLNGGVNLGQCQHMTVDVEVINDYDPTTGPQGLSSYATLRLANASEHVRGRVIAIGTGRAFRGGPTRHHNLQIVAVNCLWEAALLSGKAFHGGGTRWEDTRLDIQAVDCCQLAGTAAVRDRSFDGADLHIIARNTPELIVLRSTLTLDDEDGDPSPRATVRLVNKTATQYPHQVSLVANGSNVDITILTDDDDENTVETYTNVANTNTAVVAAINAGNIFTAYTAGPAPTALRLETKRRGTMGWRLFSEDPNSLITQDLTTSSTSIKLSPDASIIAGAGDAPLTLPVEGELRSDITGKVERVLVTAKTAVDTVSVIRHRGGTSAQAWTVANHAKLYAPLSRVTDSGGVSRRMSSGAVSIGGPYAKVNTAALDTDSKVRVISAQTVNLAQDRDVFVLVGTVPVETFTGRWKGRVVTLICESVGATLVHGTGNQRLHNAQNFVAAYANQVVRILVDTNGVNWLEVSPCSR